MTAKTDFPRPAPAPQVLVDFYGGDLPTNSDDYRAAVADLAAMRAPALRQVVALAPRYSRLARLAAVEIEKRADDRARRRIGRAMAAAVVMPVRTERVEEGF